MKLLKSKTKDKANDNADAGESRKSRKTKSAGLFGEAGLMGFLANHGEKLLLGCALIVAALLVFAGFGGRGDIDGTRTPARLQQQASGATQEISRYTWEADFQDELDLKKSFLNRAKDTLKPVEVAAYNMPQLIKPPYLPPQTLRTDPLLLAPRDLIVRGGVGPLAVNPEADGGPRGPRNLEAEGEGVRGAMRQDDPRWKDWVSGAGSVSKGTYFVSVLALVPYKEQLNEYNNRLKNTRGYDEKRDKPKYIEWFLQRAEAPSDGSEPQWKGVANHRYAVSREREWATPANEEALNAVGNFSDDRLTESIPPLLIDDLPDYVVHSGIPREVPQSEDAPEEPTEPVSPDSQFDFGPSSNRGQPRSEGGRRGEGGSERRGPPPPDREGDTRGDEIAKTTELLMFRYFDLTVRPGVTYVYRLALVLDDPNDPQDSSIGDDAPKPWTLEQSVSERLLRKRTEKLPWYGRNVATPFSEPSDPVIVPLGNRILAGAVTQPKPTSVNGKGEFLRIGDEPSAKVLALTFEPATGASIPEEIDVARGFFGNFVKSVEKKLPLEFDTILAVPNHVFNTDSLIVDIHGGQEIEGTGLQAPGEILILDRRGRLQVLNELDDTEKYKQHYIEPDEPVVAPVEDEDRKEGRGRDAEDVMFDERGRSRGGRERGGR